MIRSSPQLESVVFNHEIGIGIGLVLSAKKDLSRCDIDANTYNLRTGHHYRQSYGADYDSCCRKVSPLSGCATLSTEACIVGYLFGNKNREWHCKIENCHNCRPPVLLFAQCAS